MLQTQILRTALSAFVLWSGIAAGATLLFTTGAPDGRAGLASRPGVGPQMEIETADDFILNGRTSITGATFTGLLPSGTPLSNVNFVGVELYRVFPADSGPFDGLVPTRVNSPSDNAFDSRDSGTGGGLIFTATLVNPSFLVANSIVNGINKSLTPATSGEGPVTGEEVTFSVTFTTPFVLDPGHYFFKPEAGLPVGQGTFLWLSTPTPPIFSGDLQAWIRNSNLDPDWLRAGTDIIGGTTPPRFNESFSLTGDVIPEPSTITLLCGGVALLAWKRRRT